MWFFLRLVRNYIRGKIESFLFVIAKLFRSHPFVLEKLTPGVTTKIEQTEKIVAKTNRIQYLVIFSARMFIALILLISATSIIWNSQSDFYTFYDAKINPTPMEQSLYDNTIKSSVDIFDMVRDPFFGLSILFITMFLVIPGAIGIPFIDTILAAGSFKCALLLSPIWTIMVITTALRNLSPLNKTLILCATVVLAFAALVYLYKRGKKRMEEEKGTLILIDNVIEQIKDGKSIEEIKFKNNPEDANMSQESTNIGTLSEYVIKKLKYSSVSLIKILLIAIPVLLLLHFLNILPLSMFFMIIFPNEAAINLGNQISETLMSPVKEIITYARLKFGAFLSSFLMGVAITSPFVALVYLFKKRKEQMEEKKKRQK